MKQFINYITILGLLISMSFSQSVDVFFGDVDVVANTAEIKYNSDIEIGGAQFDLIGATLGDYSGGEAGNAGWTVSGSETTWLGFSFGGITLPAGEHVLTDITFTPNSDEICINAVVISNSTGGTVPVNIGECVSLSGSTEGCMDDSACNYDDTATEACSDCCEFADEHFDCDGNCIAELDCEDVCGGSAIYDECGECNGSGASFDCGDGMIVCEESECSSTLPGCLDEEALNYNPDATESDDSCLFDPFEWTQSTSQAFYVVNELLVNGEVMDANDSLLVLGAFCGESNIQVGSAQWVGAPSTIVVMGADGVTPGTETYCFGGMTNPIVIPADIPSFKVYDAENDVYMDASISTCLDAEGTETDCSWANFGYNNISELSAGVTVIEGCTDLDACNYDETATDECDGDNSCCEYADEFYNCDDECENDSDGDEVCDELEVVGCMDDMACNYDEMATDDGECNYELDCAGECGGEAEEDDCGVCEGDGSTCVTFNGTEMGVYSGEDCTGELVDTIDGLCYDPVTHEMEPTFSEEMCTYGGGIYIALPTCMDGWTFQPVEIDNQDECMCGDGGLWDSEYEECTSGEQGYNFWLDAIPLDLDGPMSITLLYDEDNNPTDMIINFAGEGDCEYDYEWPDQEACENAGAEWDDYNWECYVEDEDMCNELGGNWEDSTDITEYSVELNELIFFDEGDEIVAEINEYDFATTLTVVMEGGECEFDYEWPDQEACEYEGAEWDEDEEECYIEDMDICNELGGSWVENPCMGFIFETANNNVFGCTEESYENYNPEALIDDGSCGLSNYNSNLPGQFYLSENYPNPFNPVTQISYTIPEYSNVELAIYDIQGNLVEMIFKGSHKPGEFKVKINGDNMSSGFYMAVLKAGDLILTQKMVLLK